VRAGFEYARPDSPEAAAALLEAGDARPMGGGTDLLPQLDRGIRPAGTVVDLRPLGLAGIETADGALRIGATTSVAELARDPRVADGYAALATAAAAVASPQLREMGTVAGNLCQQPRCWYFRHPDLECWLRGGTTCYAQIGDHRKHNLEPGDCISAHPSDLAPALAACDATVAVHGPDGERELPLLDLYRRPTEDNRSLLTLAPGELVTAVHLPAPPDRSVYLRTGERQAFSFPLVSVALARNEGRTRCVAAGIANVPRELDPGDPLADLPGNPQTGWKRTVLATLVERALAAVAG
jgi:xanthine dehydrogenase YagS FAD-binding subunit